MVMAAVIYGCKLILWFYWLVRKEGSGQTNEGKTQNHSKLTLMNIGWLINRNCPCKYMDSFNFLKRTENKSFFLKESYNKWIVTKTKEKLLLNLIENYHAKN